MNVGKKTIIKNSSMGLISQVITILFTFITRNLFIKYIGVELLGINSTFASVLGTLALAELGFQSAITYSLYKPLYDKAYSTVNDIMNIFKIMYRGIGIFFIVSTIIVLPFLKYILKDITVDYVIYIYFILQSGASACTYFFSYKRALLYANQKDYISKIIDLITNIIFNICLCIILIYLKNYVAYLIIKIIQVYCSNLIVHLFCKKKYPFLKKAKLNRNKFKEIWKNVKNVFAGKIAGYIYGSTDNLIISAFVSTIQVGYLVNYTTITKSLRTLTQSILNPMVPIIGNYLESEENPDQREKSFLLYTHVRYLLAMFIIIPTMVLINDFITLWIGSDMLLPKLIIILLSIDFYIDLVHSASLDYIYGAGLFKAEKNIEIVGAIANIFISISLVYSSGIAGVLLGTVISQILFWIGRSYIAYYSCMELSKKQYLMYWMRNLNYIIFFIIAYLLCEKIYNLLPMVISIVKIVVAGIICELVLIIYCNIVFIKINEQKILFEAVKKMIIKTIGQRPHW